MTERKMCKGALAEAATTFGRLAVVEVTARPDVLLSRLMARGREDEATIRDRLARRAPTDLPATTSGHLLLDKSGELGVAAECLVEHINGLCGPTWSPTRPPR